MALSGLGKGAPDDVPGHGSEACGKVLVRVVVRATAADLGFATPGSTLMLFGCGPISGQSSPSRRENVLMTSRSKFV